MGLTSRKEKILQAVVDGYINTCEPISSSEIQKNHLPALSTATIRNELSQLEEMGYLVQPHTSAGRIPTAEAYRLYVEKLMPKHKLSRSELKIVKRYFNGKVVEINDILKSTAKVISEITNLTSVAYLQNSQDAVITSVKFVKISESTALVIIVTNMGVLKDTAVNIDATVTDEYCMKASNFITECFGGHKISEVIKPKKIIREVKREYRNVFDMVIRILKNYSADDMPNELVLEGSAKILEQPEYSNLQKAKAMLELLDSKNDLVTILNVNDDVNLNIKIGNDKENEGMPEYAVVTASYQINGVNVGNAGVIGPIRMDYSKVISVLDYISKTLNMLPSPEAKDELPEGRNEVSSEE